MNDTVVFDGGSEPDRARILAVHRACLDANGKCDGPRPGNI